MKNFITALKKYIWVIIVVSLVGLNSYTISLNTEQCNSNATAIITLSHGVEIVADSVVNLAKTIVRDRKITNEKINILLDREFNNEVNIKLNAEDIMINRDHIINNLDILQNITKKPSYNYLKSVTVYITGKTIPNIENEITKKEFTKNWCGTGVVVKTDAKNTYILTNKHVAGGYQNVPVEISILINKKNIKSEVIKLHKTQDLALLKIKGQLKGKAVVKGLAFPKITEKVYTVGQSLGRPYIYGEGVFSGTVIEHDIYQLPCIFGQSGSGVFNSNGELLGLVYSVAVTYCGHDFTRANVVKGIYILEFLEENLK